MKKITSFLIILTCAIFILGGITIVVKNNLDNANQIRINKEKADLKEKIDEDTSKTEKEQTIIDLKIDESEIEQ